MSGGRICFLLTYDFKELAPDLLAVLFLSSHQFDPGRESAAPGLLY